MKLYQLYQLELQLKFSTTRCFERCFLSFSIDHNIIFAGTHGTHDVISHHSHTHFCFDAKGLFLKPSFTASYLF